MVKKSEFYYKPALELVQIQDEHMLCTSLDAIVEVEDAFEEI